MGDPIGDFFSHEVTDLANYIRNRLDAAGLSILDGEVYQIEAFLLQKLHVPQPIVLIEEAVGEIESKGVHRVLVEKLQMLAAPTVNPIKAWKGHKRNISHFTETYPKLAGVEVQNLTNISEFSGPAAQQLAQSLKEEMAKAEDLLKSMYESGTGDEDLLNKIETIIEDTATGIEATGGGGIIISVVLFITALAQGFVDVFNDILDALAVLSTGQIVAGVLIVAAIAVGIALFVWLESQQGLQNALSKKVKTGPSPTPVVVPPPVNSQNNHQKALELAQEFPSIPADIFEGLLNAGYTEEEIRAMIRAGFTKDDLATVLKRTQDALKNGTDQYGLTKEQIHDLLFRNNSPTDYGVVTALNSGIESQVVEGHVALLVLKDLIRFNVGFGTNNQDGQIDIETSKFIIEVKKPSVLKGYTGQINRLVTNRTLNPTGKPVILYASGYSTAASKEVVKVGGYVVKSDKDLLDLLKRLGGP